MDRRGREELPSAMVVQDEGICVQTGTRADIT